MMKLMGARQVRKEEALLERTLLSPVHEDGCLLNIARGAKQETAALGENQV